MITRNLLVSALLVAASAVSAAPRIFVADEGSDTVSVIDGESLRRVAAVRVGSAPHNVQVSPDGRLVWVTNNGEAHGESRRAMPKGEHAEMKVRGELWALEATGGKIVAKIPVGLHPAHVVLTPDGRFAYVTNGGDDSVSIVDATVRQVVATIKVGAYPHGIRISPDGREAYVANLKGGSISIIDIGSRREVARIEVGKGPAQTGFSPDGRMAFVSLSQEDAVALIDPVSRKLLGKVPVGRAPIQIHATPDSRTLLVANQGSKERPSDTLSFIDIEKRRVRQTVRTDRGAHGVTVQSDGRRAFVSNVYANNVSVVDLASGKVVASIRVGRAPNGISLAE